MTSHRGFETLLDVFEARCSESGVSFEEKARELGIPADGLRDKLGGRVALTEDEAEKVGEFLGPDIKRQLLAFGPRAAEAINANLQNEELLRLMQLPEDRREAEFESDPELRNDFERYAGELGAEPNDQAARMVAKEIRSQATENPGGYLPSTADVGNAIEDACDRYQREVAARAGKSLRQLIKEQRFEARTWKPISYFRELADIKKTRFAQIEKGETDIKLSEIVRCSIALGVSPSVVIGDITEEEWRLVEQLRGMGDSDRELVKSLIERLGSGPSEG